MDEGVLIIVISLIFSAFFSAAEIAFLSANRLHIAILKRKGGFPNKIIAWFVEKTSLFISTTLLGNTIALVVYGIFMAEFLDPKIEMVIHHAFPQIAQRTADMLTLVIQTLLSTALVLATAEFLPKSIALAIPDNFLKLAALPMYLLIQFMRPLIWFIVVVSKGLSSLVGITYSEDKPVFGLTDLDHYLQKTQPTQVRRNAQHQNGRRKDDMVEFDKKILINAMEFKTIKVRDCLIPRKEVVAVNVEDTIAELTKVFIDSGHSKILIYQDSIDNIIGYCHQLELFKKPQTIRGMLTEIIAVPETSSANDLMLRFIAERKSIALVLDEFGGTAGIVTIEDIMEEIFGEIEDEFDDVEVDSRQADGSYLFSAREEIDHLNEKYGLSLPEGDYDTLSGYLLYLNEDLPSKDDVIETDRYVFTIVSMSGARIDQVRMIVREIEE